MYSINSIPTNFRIGRQLEHGVETVTFDISAWLATWPTLVCGISMILPGGGDPVPMTGVTQEGNTLTWVVGEGATAESGTATIVVFGVVGDDVRKCSDYTPVVVEDGHPASGEAPDAVADWLSEATALKAEVEDLLGALEEELAGI